MSKTKQRQETCPLLNLPHEIIIPIFVESRCLELVWTCKQLHKLLTCESVHRQFVAYHIEAWLMTPVDKPEYMYETSASGFYEPDPPLPREIHVPVCFDKNPEAMSRALKGYFAESREKADYCLFKMAYITIPGSRYNMFASLHKQYMPYVKSMTDKSAITRLLPICCQDLEWVRNNYHRVDAIITNYFRDAYSKAPNARMQLDQDAKTFEMLLKHTRTLGYRDIRDYLFHDMVSHRIIGTLDDSEPDLTDIRKELHRWIAEDGITEDVDEYYESGWAQMRDDFDPARVDLGRTDAFALVLLSIESGRGFIYEYLIETRRHRPHTRLFMSILTYLEEYHKDEAEKQADSEWLYKSSVYQRNVSKFLKHIRACEKWPVWCKAEDTFISSYNNIIKLLQKMVSVPVPKQVNYYA